MASKKEQLKDLANRPRPANLGANPAAGPSLVERAQLSVDAVATRTASSRHPAYPEQIAASPTPPHNSDVIVELRLDIIHDNPYNARVVYDPVELQELAASIAITKKVDQPIKVVPHPTIPGHYVSVYGHRRRRASKMARLDFISAIVVAPMPNLELYLTSDRENKHHSPQTFIDNAYAWRKLLADRVVPSQTDLATVTSVSEGFVGKTLSILELPATVLDLMKEHSRIFGLTHAYELYLLCKKVGEADTLALASRIIAEGLSSRQVEKIRQDIAEPKYRKTKDLSRQYKFPPTEAMPVGVLKEWDTGKIVLEVKIVDPEKRIALVEQIKGLIATL